MTQITHTLLGPDASFEGKLEFEGDVRIDGRFRGEIVSNDRLIIGEGAVVYGNVQVGTLVLNGNLEGQVHVRERRAASRPTGWRALCRIAPGRQRRNPRWRRAHVEHIAERTSHPAQRLRDAHRQRLLTHRGQLKPKTDEHLSSRCIARVDQHGALAPYEHLTLMTC